MGQVKSELRRAGNSCLLVVHVFVERFHSQQDLIVASDYLIIPSLKSKASQFLEELIDESNCFALESFASQYTASR